MVEKWTRTIENYQLKIDERESETDNVQSELTTNLQSSIVNSQSKAPMNFEKAVEEFEGDKEFLMEILR